LWRTEKKRILSLFAVGLDKIHFVHVSDDVLLTSSLSATTVIKTNHPHTKEESRSIPQAAHFFVEAAQGSKILSSLLYKRGNRHRWECTILSRGLSLICIWYSGSQMHE
jgi:hypothetical protein